MTVRELIELLQELEQDQFILVKHEGLAYDLSSSIKSEKVHEGLIGATSKKAVECYLLDTWT